MELGRNSEPIWSPDSNRIAYHSAGQPGGPGILTRRADGVGGVDRLTTDRCPCPGRPTKWIANAILVTGAFQSPL